MDFAMNSSQLLLALSAIIFFLIVTIWCMRRFFHRNIKPRQVKGGRNKYREVDLFRFRPAFLKLGLASALLSVIFAFSWTDAPLTDRQQFEVGTLEVDIEVIPRTIERPKPTPPPPSVIEEVEEEKMLEEEEIEFVDMSITDKSAVEKYEKKEKSKPDPLPMPTKIVEKEEMPDIFIRAEEMPSLESCARVNDREEKWTCTQKAMLGFVYDQIKYPPIARENGVQGTVVVSFVIDEEGQITNVEMLRDIGAGCGDEVLRIVDLLNTQLSWSPGKQRGIPVKVSVNLPVKFKLQ